jgi:hypothetical protein
MINAASNLSASRLLYKLTHHQNRTICRSQRVELCVHEKMQAPIPELFNITRLVESDSQSEAVCSRLEERSLPTVVSRLVDNVDAVS